MYKKIISLIALVSLSACAAPETGEEVRREVVKTPPAETQSVEDVEVKAVDTGLEASVLYKLLLAEISGQRGASGDAAENYLDVAKSSRDPAVAKRAVQMALMADDLASAIDANEVWVEAEPESVEAHTNMGILYLRSENADAAAKQFIWVVEQDAEPSAALTRVGRLLLREQSKQTSVAVAQRLAEKFPQVVEAHHGYASLALAVGALETAVAESSQVVAMRPEWDSGWRVYTRALTESGEGDRALEELQQAINEQPDNTSLHIHYARLLANRGKLEESRDIYAELLENNPADPDLLYAMGLLELNSNNRSEARAHFEQLVIGDKHRDAAYYYLGQIAENERDEAAAIDAYRRVGRGDYLVEARIRIATIEGKNGNLEQSRRFFSVMRDRHDTHAVRFYLAESSMLRDLGQYQEAVDLLGEALESYPEEHDLLYARALLAERVDKLDLLEQDLNTILARDPDNAAALNALGYTLADRTDRLDDALVLIQRAYKLKPDDPAVIDSMGWVHYRLGRSVEARGYLEKALELSGDPEIAAHLGEVLWQMGEQALARAVWAKAREANPDHDILLQVIERFEN